MLIGGFQKSSLVDYPGKICAIIFTQGCGCKCGYCHNPELVDPEKFTEPIPEEEILSFLKTRQGKLDAVEITGGEPTLQTNLIEFIQKIKELGFLVKLDSNGSRPEILQKIADLKLADYFAMDVKAPLERYREITNSEIDPDNIKKSIGIIMNSGADYEFRTTIVKGQLRKDDFVEIGKLIKGAKLYFLQKFVPSKTNDPEFLKKGTYNDEEFAEFQELMEPYVQKCFVR